MKNKGKKIIAVSILFIGILIILLSMNFLNLSNNIPKVSTWVWSEDWLTYTDDILEFSEQNNIEQLFIQITFEQKQEKIRNFIRDARINGINIYALQGDSRWAVNHDDVLDWVKYIHDFNANSLPDERFTGIVLDIEPYLLPQWNSNQQNTVEQFVNMIEKVNEVNLTGNQSLPIIWTIPFWFDGIHYNSQYTLGEWIIKNSDIVAVMDYRNFVEGKDGILYHIEHEMEWANKYDKALIIILETEKNDIPKITFSHLGKLELMNTMEEINNRFKNNPSYSGISIHHLESFRKLK